MPVMSPATKDIPEFINLGHADKLSGLKQPGYARARYPWRAIAIHRHQPQRAMGGGGRASDDATALPEDAEPFEGTVTYVSNGGAMGVVDSDTYVPARNLGRQLRLRDYVVGMRVSHADSSTHTRTRSATPTALLSPLSVRRSPAAPRTSTPTAR